MEDKAQQLLTVEIQAHAFFGLWSWHNALTFTVFNILFPKMMKFVPTSAEKNLLNDHNKEIEQFARADRFLYEMSRLAGFLQGPQSAWSGGQS